MRSVRYLLSGYYGFGNPGDEAILASVVHALKRVDSEADCTVLSADPEVTQAVHGVAAVPRARPGAVIRALRRCDLLISGGGSLLQDVTSRRSLYYYLAVLALARACRRPFMIYGQGIGPIREPQARQLTARVLRHAAAITLRDQPSADELRRMFQEAKVHRHAPIQVVTDPVYALPTPPKAPASTASVVAVCLRDWPGLDQTLPAVAGALETLIQAGWRVLFVPFHEPEDRAVANRCLQLLRPESRPAATVAPPAPPTDPYRWVWEQVAGARACLAMRLHAAIFATLAGVPVVGLAYDPKVQACLEQLKSASFPLEGLSPERLAQAVRSARPANLSGFGDRALISARKAASVARGGKVQ